MVRSGLRKVSGGSDVVNGVYEPTEETHNGKVLYRKIEGVVPKKSDGIYLRFVRYGGTTYWAVSGKKSSREHRGGLAGGRRTGSLSEANGLCFIRCSRGSTTE